MSHILVASDGPVVDARAMPPMTWNGTLVAAAETATHYLHLSAFACEKCNGPVIAGFMGTRHDDISKETDIRSVGAACITCGFRPEILIEPSVEHRFRPIEWNRTVRARAQQPSLAEPPQLEQDAKS
ncbi:MAG TPA: hypothetical protein VKL99_02100 [Candidatus Angelobacter sp.]|nr:hypothetical protein [Candidatus Angelobacter sp.]